MTDAAPPAARTETGADLRRLILDHTRRLLVTGGYDGLSMRKIARGVGCSATSIYLHFEGKDALTHALIDEGMRRLYAELDAQAEDRPARRLDALCRAYVRFGLANPEYYQVMFQLHPERMARYPPEDYRRARRNVELFGEALADGAAAGVLRLVSSPDVAAMALWTALHGLVSLLLAERVDARVAGDAFIDAAVRQALAAFEVQ
ncbi:TetR/AcrR family transcriptional regulator [Rubrivirga litoralis]|uniref:TetR/AcrR family transcriptional regulator n=1 Tax=Rubrivirga litoralis TaxID=3075598 RepID=A0ABU3BSH1_9BACT|nr:TetR/AcrR family transcriptional regulator [Rubrivirga sp. F394]MDT0632245.1 TetR/AcrR family transcriptional regulator [Rubrivirga sp. F394]